MVDAQWTPDGRETRIADFARHCEIDASDYAALHRWSVTDIDAFWRAVWDYFAVQGESPAVALADPAMPGARWFPGVTLNYVDQVRRHARAGRPAIIAVSEGQSDRAVSWLELLRSAGALAATLRDLGVGEGDRVAGYLPNIPEAVIAFLATASLGAVWSSCGQDYPAKAALDRLGQLEPTVLVTADGYRYNGVDHDRRDDVDALRVGLRPRATILVSRLAPPMPDTVAWTSAVERQSELSATRVAFDHPLWIVFSSGTTGLPKGIAHGHGGVVLEHLKAVALQSDIGPDDTFFWYTSPSWMMWNFQVAGLLVGTTIVCYDGSPTAGQVDALWLLAARLGVTVLGTSPGYVLACEKAGVVPRMRHDLAALRTVGITGASLPPALSLWLRDNVGHRVQVASISGGTDVVSAFVGAAPTVPVWPGELSAPYLGVALDAYNEQGESVRGEVGELVITAPMPSMPVGFWRDPDGSRYREAYFDTYPGVWRHGDWITITERGSVVVHGRSDSTLNRNGVRMGTADIYQAVEALPEIVEALVLGVERPDGAYWMPLFVVLADGLRMTDDLVDRIRAAIRTDVSHRHLPDEIIAAPGIPHTRTGKKLEVPLKRLFQGADPARVVDLSAVDNPDLLAWFVHRVIHKKELSTTEE